jgi:hypothetical protein
MSNSTFYLGHEDSVGMSVCKVHISATVDGVFTPKLLLPYRNVGQQQRALMVYSKNVQLWHPFLAKSDTRDTFEIC